MERAYYMTSNELLVEVNFFVTSFQYIFQSFLLLASALKVADKF